MYKFLKSDLVALIEKRDKLAEQVREAGRLIGEAVNQSSETWHDNAPYDIAKLQFEQAMQRYTELDGVVKQAEVTESVLKPPKRVELGTRVRFKDSSGEAHEIKIGSYIPADDSEAISYNAPVAQILMNRKVGDLATGMIMGRPVSYNIIEITS